jgi:phage terminase large subunit-like protein
MRFDGADAIAWIQKFCRVPKGPAAGHEIVLLDFQKEILRGVFNTPTRLAIISMGRQNGKTALAAALVLLHLCGPRHQRNGTIVSSALTREQAGLLFEAARTMVRASPELTASVDVVEFQKTLRCRELGTSYRALSADAPAQLGLSPFLTIHDELGQVRGPFSKLFDVLESGGAAQKDPLSLVISTQAAQNSDLLSMLIDDAASAVDPRTKLFLWTASPGADPFAEETWREANPALGHFLNVDEVRGQAETARRMPSMEASFRNLVLNERIETAAAFVSPAVWNACDAQPKPLQPGDELSLGLDLSMLIDLTAIIGVGADGGVYPFCWAAEEGLAEKSRRDKVDYTGMVRDGHLLLTPGPTIDYDRISVFMRGLFDTYKVQAVAFDRVYMRFLRPCLVRAGFTEAELARFVEVGQGFIGMGPCIRELETRLLGKKLQHGGHPLLLMAAQNAAVVSDDAGNKKFTKRRSAGRIDPIVALAMAVSVIPPEPPYVPTYRMEIFGPRRD